MVTMLETLAGWGAAAIGLGGAGALLRRRLSRDRTVITTDRAESRFVENLLRERDNAIAESRAALASQADTEASIARLTAQNEGQAREIDRLTREFSAFRRMVLRLNPGLSDFLVSGSDFNPLRSSPG